MEAAIGVILQAGRSAMELVLFTLLPIMVVMLVIMRFLEAKGVLNLVAAWLAPLVRPFGLTGLSVFAAVQISFVGFAAPIATLATMERRGSSDRHLAATLAMVLAMAPANAVFPLISMGLRFAPVLAMSIIGGLVAASATYWGFGRHLVHNSHAPVPADEAADAGRRAGLLDIVQQAGAEAIAIAKGIVPILIVSLVFVSALTRIGATDLLARWLAPSLDALAIDKAFVVPTITKYLAGCNAMVGVVHDMMNRGQADASLMNRGAGFLLHPLDLPGLAVLASAGRRVAATWKPAACGAAIGVVARMICQSFLT